MNEVEKVVTKREREEGDRRTSLVNLFYIFFSAPPPAPRKHEDSLSYNGHK